MEDKEFKEINVVPFVDVMLVLLTIVLITATFVVQGSIPVNLPTASSQGETNKKGIEIVITKEGEVLLEGRRIELEELEKILKALEKTSPIEVFADRDAKVQNLVSILDILKREGFAKVSLKSQTR